MVIGYFDTSAIVPILIDEANSQIAGQTWMELHRATTVLTHVEVRAAMARALRNGRIDRARLQRGKQAWEELAQSALLIDVGRREIAIAAEMSEVYALRTNDALHLASADSIADSEPVFVSADHRLLAAASRHGMVTIPLGM